MKHLLLVFTFFVLNLSFAANTDSLTSKHNLGFKGGLMFDSYNSGGFRFMVSYEHKIAKAKNLYWGIGYDTKLALFRPATDIYGPPELTTQNFSFNLHYHAFFWKKRIGWNLSIGPTITHAFETMRYSTRNLALFGLHIGADFNVKLGKKIYFQTAPLFFLPPAGSDVYLLNGRAYKSPYRGYRIFTQYSVLPLGLRFEL
jgi:hypothetical protein